MATPGASGHPVNALHAPPLDCLVARRPAAGGKGAAAHRLDAGDGLRLGAEAGLPLYQKVNGYQPPRDFSLHINLSKAF